MAPRKRVSIKKTAELCGVSIAIAHHACELLVRQMNQEPIEKKRIVVPTSILRGQTL